MKFKAIPKRPDMGRNGPKWLEILGAEAPRSNFRANQPAVTAAGSVAIGPISASKLPVSEARQSGVRGLGMLGWVG